VARFTPFQGECLVALGSCPNQIASADVISARLKRGRAGRLAVTSALRALLRADDGSDPLVVRLAPRDRWGAAQWCLTPRSRRLLEELAGRVRQRDATTRVVSE